MSSKEKLNALGLQYKVTKGMHIISNQLWEMKP